MCEKGSTYGLVWVGDPWRVCLGCTMAFVMLLQPLFTVTVTSRRDHPEMILRLWLDTKAQATTLASADAFPVRILGVTSAARILAITC